MAVKRWLFSFSAILTLTGFHGCLNDKVHQQTHPSTDGKLIRFVDTRAGTGGAQWIAGHNTPAVQVPWGMVKLGPDTTSFGKVMGLGGYSYSDVNLRGFSHTRFVGAGVYGGGVLSIVPANTPLEFGALRKYQPTFSHRNETAVPGYYSVALDRLGIQAELTTTARVGLHRYTFTLSSEPVLYLDLGGMLASDGKNTELSITLTGGNKIEGHFLQNDGFSGRYGGLHHYFEMHFPTGFVSHRYLTASGASLTLPAGDPKPLYLELRFATSAPVEVRTALSFTGAAGAAANFTAEAPLATSFDTIQAATQNTWEAWLARVAIATSQEAEAQKFYTALYNSARMPTLFGDYDGALNESYRGFDNANHITTGFSYYSDFSLWDTFRTVHPLYNLLARTEQLHMIQSMHRMAEQSGRFPRWAAGTGHTDSMLGFPAAITLAESYRKGITTFDGAGAYALLKNQMTAGSGISGTECLDSYSELGFCPSDDGGTTVSRTLEYSWADTAMAGFAAALGNSADADYFTSRAENFRNAWSAADQAFIPRKRDGQYFTGCRLDMLSYFSPTGCASHFTEGSPLQHRWALPTQAAATSALYAVSALAELETFFLRAPKGIAAPVPNGYYWHGNEPALFAAVYFNHLGRPDRAQYWTDWIRRTKYDNTSVGIDGNDDGGTLSAWFVLASLGFLPGPGTTTYEIVSPAFESASVNLGGSTLLIVATGATQGKRFVRGVTINGTPLTAPRFDHSLIQGGATMEFQMVEEPAAWQ